MAPTPGWTESLRVVIPDERIEAVHEAPWPDVLPKLRVFPVTPEQVAAVLKYAGQNGLAVVPTGRGTKLGWGPPPRRCDVLLDLSRLSEVVAHEPGDMTVTVQPGVPFGEVQDRVLAEGGRIPIHPRLPDTATVGGVLASGVSGPLHAEIREAVLGMQIATADGTLIRSGSRVVKNVAGFDIHKLLVGSAGTLGVITEVTLRLHPKPPSMRLLGLRLLAARTNDALAALRASMVRPAWTILEKTGAGAMEGAELDLWLVLEGEKEGVARHAAEAPALLEPFGARPTSGKTPAVRGVDIWRRRMGRFPGGEPGVFACRGAVHPLQMVDFLVREAPGPALASVEAGLVHVAVRIAEGGGSNEPEGMFRHMEAGGAGACVDGPWPSDPDAWRLDPLRLELMARIKRAFDPGGVLSPGRAPGGP